MGILINGNKPSKIIYNGAEASLYFNGSKIWPEEAPVPLDEVQIGNQIWKTKNLAIDDGQGGITTKTVNYGQGDVIEYYYNWEAALRVANTIDGWHLPSSTEWSTLATAVGGTSTGGTKLKSTYGWNNDGNGTDDYGFAGFPAGNVMNGGYHFNVGARAQFWTSNETSEMFANTRSFTVNANIQSTNEYKTDYFSIRLVKDAT